MDGHSVTYANTGSGPQYLDSPGAKAMTAWYDIWPTRGIGSWSRIRCGRRRALALEDTEYMVYIEKPGPLELPVVRHGYDVFWIDPARWNHQGGQEVSGDHFTAEPPDR